MEMVFAVVLAVSIGINVAQFFKIAELRRDAAASADTIADLQSALGDDERPGDEAWRHQTL